MNKNKDVLNFILRIVLSGILHFCWLWLYICMHVLSENPIRGGKLYDFACFYFMDYWQFTIPITAILFNLIIFLVCKLLPVKNKIFAIIHWIISIVLSLVLLSPWIMYCIYS